MTSSYALADLIDLDRYPIHDLAGAGKEFVAQCRTLLDEAAMCALPGFVKPAALADILAEIEPRRDRTYWMETERRAYSWRDPAAYPEVEAVAHTNPNRIGSITLDEFPRDGAFVSMFEQPALTEFVRQCIGQASLHPVACPYLAANVKVMSEGCEHAWHFDQNDGAVTLLFQSARDGGDFEYVPYLRDEGNENYEAVSRLMAGDHAAVVRPQVSEGSFCLFKGRRSIHRVNKVTSGAPDRLLAVFSYHREPGHRYRESTICSVLGRLPDDYQQSL